MREPSKVRCYYYPFSNDFQGRKPMPLTRQIYCAVFVTLLLACDSSAQSLGYWHLPSTPAQYCGLGFGPGHHAPIIRTHCCRPPRVPRCVHTRGCLSGGLAYCGSIYSAYEIPGCHAELDSLVSPESAIVAPEPSEPLFSSPDQPNDQVLPTPQSELPSTQQD